jgi:hypothetical protein
MTVGQRINAKHGFYVKYNIFITYIADWEPLYDEIWILILNKEHKRKKKG